jgi:hypothetical protein
MQKGLTKMVDFIEARPGQDSQGATLLLTGDLVGQNRRKSLELMGGTL